jgi:hypothetical protein
VVLPCRRLRDPNRLVISLQPTSSSSPRSREGESDEGLVLVAQG